jgi:N-acetylneuraminic acid mutarotase
MILRFFHSTIFCLFLFNTELIFSQSWNQTTSFPGTPRDDASYFKLGSKHYIGTGREVGFGCTRDIYSFDENTLTWNASASLPVGKERQYASSCSWNGKGYLFGGVDCAGIYQNDLWTYDPVTDSWTELSVLPAAGRAGMVAFLLNDTWFVVGGKNTNGTLNEVWTYNFTSQTWVQKNNIPTDGIWRGIAFTFQNKGYIGLGRNNLNNQTGINSEILKYDSNLDSWSVVPNLNWGTRSYIGHAQTDSLLFLFGGLSETNQILVSTERIHLNDFSVEILADFPSIPRKGGVSFLVQNNFYYSTGVSTDTRFNETWQLANVSALKEITSFKVQIFPNPSSTEITIEATEPILSIEIIDELGRLQFAEKINNTHFNFSTNLLESGNYFVKIKTENGERIEKLVVVAN